MNTYLRNLSLWLRGFGKLRTLRYKPGWGPWAFLLPYCTTYLLGTLAGYGVVSLSRAWFDRSTIRRNDYESEDDGAGDRWRYPFARWVTRLLNWAFPGSRHGRETGPRLWGSENLRD